MSPPPAGHANSPDFLSPGLDTPRESSELLDCVRVVWALHLVVALGRAVVPRMRGAVRGESCRFVKEMLQRNPNWPLATGETVGWT